MGLVGQLRLAAKIVKVPAFLGEGGFRVPRVAELEGVDALLSREKPCEEAGLAAAALQFLQQGLLQIVVAATDQPDGEALFACERPQGEVPRIATDVALDRFTVQSKGAIHVE